MTHLSRIRVRSSPNIIIRTDSMAAITKISVQLAHARRKDFLDFSSGDAGGSTGGTGGSMGGSASIGVSCPEAGTSSAEEAIMSSVTTFSVSMIFSLSNFFILRQRSFVRRGRLLPLLLILT